MKKIFLLLLLLVAVFELDAQKLICKDVNDIAAAEAMAYAAKLNGVMLSNASDNFSVHYCVCKWKVDPAINYIAGAVTFYFTATAAASNLVFDCSDSLTVDSVLMRADKLPFAQAGNETLTIQLPQTYEADSMDSLTIFYQGVPPGSGFGSFVQSTHNEVPVIWTLSEPYGAKDWWPCRNGLDDKIDSIDIFIEHPAAYSASSNGILKSIAGNDSTVVTHFKHRYPIAAYLVGIAITNYQRSVDSVALGNTKMPVYSYAYPESADTFKMNLDRMLNALKLYDSALGTYPFIRERYGQTQFGFRGGMEHQTNSFISSPDENLMAHELSHQWFGNKITLGSWEDIWLNEGFATFCASFWYYENFQPTQYKTNVENVLASIISDFGGSVKVNDTANVGRIFDGRLSYNKGAFLLRMLRWTLGDSLFFAGIRSYVNDTSLAYKFARTTDLKRNLEKVSNTDLTYFFNQWYTGEGYPSFTVRWTQGSKGAARVFISQSSSHPSVSFFKVPLALTFKNATQQKTIVVQDTVNNQSFIADVGFVADTLLIDEEHYLISGNNRSLKLTKGSVTPVPRKLPGSYMDKINSSMPEIKRLPLRFSKIPGRRND